MFRSLNLLDEQAVLAEMHRLVEAQSWQQLQDLRTAHACAKQSKNLLDAEAALLARLSPSERARRLAGGPVCVTA